MKEGRRLSKEVPERAMDWSQVGGVGWGQEEKARVFR